MGLGSTSSDSGNDMPPFERPWAWALHKRGSDGQTQDLYTVLYKQNLERRPKVCNHSGESSQV